MESIEEDISTYFRKLIVSEEEKFFPADITIEDQEGAQITAFDKEGGKYTVLNLWATWCPPCIKELPSLKRLNSSVISKKGWRVIAVSLDSKENREKVLSFTEKYKLSEVALYFDNDLTLQKTMHVPGLPLTWILDDEGRILYEMHGDAQWDRMEIITFLLGVRATRQ